MIKRPLINTLISFSLSASMLLSTTANAAYTEVDAPALVAGFAADMASWMATPTGFTWNPENVRVGNHPDRPDGVIYIFPDNATADLWWDGVTGNAPAGIPDSAVGYVHWALDNFSGEFPGIMAISDDTSFKTNNCIMASGTTIIDDTVDPPVPIAKTCGNDSGTSKRFKFVALKADVPIDIVFNTTTKDLVYSQYSVPADGVDLPIDDNIFRNYRYIMKMGNGTATDTVKLDNTAVSNDGTRLVGIKVELGFGVGSAFTASTADNTDGLAYELNLCIAERYFDERSGNTTDGDNCVAGKIEVWLENEFATFSPSMYSIVGDKRKPEGGYWDKNPAGIYAPQIQTGNIIDSGANAYVPNVTSNILSFGDLIDPFPPAGQLGQITSNYFDIAGSQAATAVTPVPTGIFGYMMPYGVFEDGDPGLIPMGIYVDGDGDPDTEGSVHAWWDASSATCCYRWGIDRDKDGVVGPDAWGLVSEADLAALAELPLDENQVLPPPRYEVAFMDDLGGLNVDTLVKLTPNYDTVANPTFTIRFTAQSVAAAGILPTDPGVADGPWVANPAIDVFHPTISGTPATVAEVNKVYSFTPVGGSRIVNDALVYSIVNKPSWASFDTTTGALTGTPVAADTIDTTDIVITVTSTNGLSTSLAPFNVTVITPPTISGTPATVAEVNKVYSFTPVGGSRIVNDALVYSIVNKPSWASFDTTTGALTGTPVAADTIDTTDIVITVTSTNGLSTSLAPFNVTVLTYTGSGGSCSYRPDGSFDPLLPGLVLIALAYLSWRPKKKGLE